MKRQGRRPANGCYLRVPGLLGPLPREAAGLLQPSSALEQLARLLSRAHRHPHDPSPTGVPGLLPETPDSDAPAGPLGLLGAGGTPGDAYWFRADPVHLLPDRDQLRLIGPEALALESAEAAALVASINDYFRDDGLELHAPLPDAWFLRCATAPRLATVPLDRARDVPLGEAQPAGDDARWWQARLNEMQMLLHAHPVNQAREESGTLTVNGIWPWGGGTLPAIRGSWDVVFSDDPFVRGLALAAGMPVEPWPRDPQPVRDAGAEGSVLAVAPALPPVHDGDTFARWEAAIHDLAGVWVPPLEQALRTGQWRAATLDAGPGRPAWRLTRASLRAFWRRPKPFSRFLEPV